MRPQNSGTQAHAALEGEGLAGQILEVGIGQLHAHTADLGLGIAIVAHRRHLHVGLESVRIGVLEVLQLGRPGDRADDVHVDSVGAPLRGGDAGQTANAFLGGGVGALTIVAEQARAGGEVDHGALGLLQVGIAGLHIIEGGVQAGIEGEVEVLGGVIGQRHAGSARLGVVDEHIDAAERLDGLVDDVLDDGLVVSAGGHVGLNRQDLHAVETLDLLLGVLQLLHVASGDDDVGALLGVGGDNAIADGAAALSVAQNRTAAAGDDGGLIRQKSHGDPLLFLFARLAFPTYFITWR